MKTIFSLSILLTLLISCQDKSKNEGYIIQGTTKHIPDSTRVLLYLYPKTDEIADSAIVVNDKFSFEGKVKRPTLAHLRIISSRDNKTFWLENKKIRFEGEKGKFSNAQITGSDTQKEAELLLKRKDSVFKEMERLEAMVTDGNRDSLFKIYEQIQLEEIKINLQFINDHPDSYESLFRLNVSKERLGAAETDKAFTLLNPELQTTEEGKTIEAFIISNKNLKIGDQFIDIEQPDINGHRVKLSEIKGKYTLIEFWASWCGPCRSFNPELTAQYELHKDKGFEILGVSLDTDKEKWGEAIEKDGLSWVNVSDLKGFNNEAAMIYGVRDIPDNFLIDEHGVIIARFIRGEELKDKLRELFYDNTGS